MGTKTIPGLFDCDDKQLPGEPGFKLLARDPTSDGLVALWAAIRSGDPILATTLSAKLISECVPRYQKSPTEPEQIEEARICADQMRVYRSTPR
jgi:hypothetical protein